MPDDRTYIRVHDGLDEHPKVEPLSDAAFRLLMQSWFYCSRNRTDGLILETVWKRRGTPKARRELIAAGLVEQGDGHVMMHDYLKHQRSAMEIKLLQEVRGDTGSYGNHVRWHVVRRKPKKDCEHCQKDADPDRKPIANGIANGSQTDRKAVASTEAETETEQQNYLGGVSHASRGGAAQPPLYPDHCEVHADEPTPPPCGKCADTRKANRTRPALALVSPTQPAKVPHCGQCDETRHISTPVGVIRCPRCHPLAEEAS